MDRAARSVPSLNFRPAGASLVGPVKYAIGQYREGVVVLARSQDGLCAIFLADKAEELCDELRVSFPTHSIREAVGELRQELSNVVALLEGRECESDMRLDIAGTAFQQQVWKALCAIPSGEARTYGQITRSIGASHSSRAVANACAANRLAVAVPCHRAVRGDGKSSGYRWGSSRKSALQAAERTR